MNAPTPAGWYPDPESSATPAPLRWWDGSAWTEHRTPAPNSSSSDHVAGSEYGGAVSFGSAPAPPEDQPTPASSYAQQPGHYQQSTQDQWIAHGSQAGNQAASVPHPQQVQVHSPPAASTSQGYSARSPYTENVMAVSQRRKLIELTNEYDIYGSDGAVIGKVTEVGQSGLKKAARFLTSLDQYMTHTLEVRDAANQLLMTLIRPAKIMKSTLIVQHPNGAEMGRLVQRNVFGKIRFGMEVNGQDVGSLNAQNWIAWDFRMQDADGYEIGRISKEWEGLLTTMFTTADKYAVQLQPNLTEPLKSLCLAAALCVDTALKQDSRGLG